MFGAQQGVLSIRRFLLKLLELISLILFTSLSDCYVESETAQTEVGGGCAWHSLPTEQSQG